MQRIQLVVSAAAILAACAHSPPAERTLSCSTGESCFDAGAATYDGAEPRGDATAEELTIATLHFVRACELGYDRGCHVAGNMYRLGLGVEKDLATARRYYERVCDEATYPEACYNLSLVDDELRDAERTPL